MAATTAYPLNVGEQFARTTARPYTEDGERRQHRITLRCEVVSTDDTGFAWRALETLAETGRPVSFPARVPEQGEMAWFGLAAAMRRGDVEVG